MLVKREEAKQVKMHEVSSSFSEENITVGSCIESVKTSSYDGNKPDEHPICSSNDAAHTNRTAFGSDHVNSIPDKEIRKKARQSQWSQLTMQSFFQKNSRSAISHDNSKSDHSLNETIMDDPEGNHPEQSDLNDCTSTQDQGVLNTCRSSEAEKSNVALLEWQRIQQLMQSSIPLCKGHHEQCVARVVKKEGPNFGRRFYVCARAEGPASNPESNCGYFKWAASKPRGQR